MARLKDEKRRTAILLDAKRLFAKRGFNGTSIADIVRESGFPVGSIYTYFSSKEEIVRVIIDEGWAEFRQGFLTALESETTPERRLSLIVNSILPELLKDSDLITIILSEAAVYADLGAKLEELTTILFDLLRQANKNPGAFDAVPREYIKSAILIYFSGMLTTVRLSRDTNLGISTQDVLAFTRETIKSSMGLTL